MDFSLPDHVLALREGLSELLTGACTPATIRAAWDGDPCEDLWKELGSFGLLGLLVPEPDGGLGLDEVALVAALEQAGYAGVPGPLVETVCTLPDLGLPVDGSARVTIMRFETPYARTSTHVLDPDGDALGELARMVLDPVDSVDRSRQVAVVRGGADQVALTAQQIHLVSQRATLGTAAFLLGLARRQLDLTVDYLKNRKQFGVPIGTFQGLKHPLAEAVVGTEFAWPVVLHAGHALAAGEHGADVAVSHAKAAASDAAYRMSRVCLQAHGAMGYTVEYDLHLFMKRTWALAKDWGSAAEHRARIAKGLGL